MIPLATGSVSLPIPETSIAVLVVSLLLTAVWLASLYR
jgi:hypothetical protein